MGQNKRKLSGVFSPVVTPFRSDELALDDLRFNLRKLNETNLAGYLALGSNGEFKSLSDKEQNRILEVFAEEKGSKVVLVGAGPGDPDLITLKGIHYLQRADIVIRDYLANENAYIT